MSEDDLELLFLSDFHRNNEIIINRQKHKAIPLVVKKTPSNLMELEPDFFKLGVLGRISVNTETIAPNPLIMPTIAAILPRRLPEQSPSTAEIIELHALEPKANRSRNKRRLGYNFETKG
jgi:hypothetical protein